ncbi:hypothetical protein BGW37DRAFT_469402 [Umbelopsis sp. PMI_123]|nr:hypothetical protein BGW37DRAFT_469402 [Umbelopsis sp. PMI_123]
MSEQVLSNDVENLTTSAPATSMSKQEADKTVVKGIAQKYEVAIKIHAAKVAREGIQHGGEDLHQNTMLDSEVSGVPDAENVIQHEKDEHPNNPVNEYQSRSPPANENNNGQMQEKEGQREQHLNKQMNKRENPELDPSIERSHGVTGGARNQI